MPRASSGNGSDPGEPSKGGEGGTPPTAEPAGPLLGGSLPGLLPTPAEMIAYLDRFVLGQERAKRDLATAVYSHYLGCAYADAPGAKYPDLERQHILLLGPTGSGKTFLVRTLANLLNVPVVTASATSFAETGYVGQHTDDLIRQLMARCDNDVGRALRGIIFIDELDKLKRSPGGMNRDVSGEGVQNALLTMLDGGVLSIGADSKQPGADAFDFDVSKVLFVATGAFVGLTDITRRRLGAEGGFGFSPPPADAKKRARRSAPVATLSDGELLERVETADLTEFGIIPELLGRFSTITALHPLRRQDLIDIMSKGGASPLAKLKETYDLHGVTLTITPEALGAIAESALALNTGARGLRRTLMKLVDDTDYQLPDLAAKGVLEVVYGVECVTGDPPARAVLRVEGNAQQAGGKEKKNGAEKPGTLSPRSEALRRGALLPRKPGGTVGGDGPVGNRRGGGERGGGHTPLRRGISDTTHWPVQKIKERLEVVKAGLGWEQTTGSARKWWTAFEEENTQRLSLVLLLAEELAVRTPPASITEFFMCYVYSNTDNIQANLHYLDYTRLKKEEEKKNRGRRGSGTDDSPTEKR